MTALTFINDYLAGFSDPQQRNYLATLCPALSRAESNPSALCRAVHDARTKTRAVEPQNLPTPASSDAWLNTSAHQSTEANPVPGEANKSLCKFQLSTHFTIGEIIYA